jgi:formate dehydrogenase subunit gamma
MASGSRVRRFSVTERVLHWLLAVTFFVMFATGLCLYLPALAQMLDRPTAKAWHIDAAIALGVGILLVVAVGNRRAAREFIAEADRFDRDDLAWLRGGPRRLVDHEDAPPQGRLNAGQKLNTAITLGLMVVLAVSGALMWLGETDTRFRFAGTVLTHDFATMLICAVVCGHLYLALLHPLTREALSGMLTGDVDRDWAARNHAKWVASLEPDAPPGDASVAASLAPHGDETLTR